MKIVLRPDNSFFFFLSLSFSGNLIGPAWILQYETQYTKICSEGGMIHKGRVLEAIEIQDTRVMVWHIFGHWQPTL